MNPSIVSISTVAERPITEMSLRRDAYSLLNVSTATFENDSKATMPLPS